MTAQDKTAQLSGTVSVKWVKPVSIGKKEMRLYACVDPNGILTGRSASPTHSAKTQAIDYVGGH